MGYRYIPDSRFDQQPAADGHSVYRVPGNNHNNNNNNDSKGDFSGMIIHLLLSSCEVAKLVCHAVNQMANANDRYLFFFFSEPRAIENVHDTG